MFYPYEENGINYKDSVYGTVIGSCRTEYLSVLRITMWLMLHSGICKKGQRFYVLYTEKLRKIRMLMYV